MIKFKNERFNLATSGNPSGSIFQYLRSRTPTCTYAVKDLSLSLSLPSRALPRVDIYASENMGEEMKDIHDDGGSGYSGDDE